MFGCQLAKGGNDNSIIGSAFDGSAARREITLKPAELTCKITRYVAGFLGGDGNACGFSFSRGS